MKKQASTMLRVVGVSLIALLTGFTVVGCIDTSDHSRPIEGPTGVPNSFDFSTTEEVQLDVKYDIPVKDYKIQFEVYFENPMTTDADGQVVKRTDIAPKVIRQTDGDGNYHSKEIIPANYGTDIYIYTSYIGVPMLYKTTVTAASIHAEISWDTMVDAVVRSRAVTRADFQQVPAEYNTLGSWDSEGRPNYLDTEGSLELSTSILKTINHTIPEGGNCPQEYRQSADFEIQDPQGRDTEIKVRFIGGTSSAQSVFGYYCYRAGATTEQIRQAQKNVVFPNTKTGVGVKGGECVKLHYIDEQGKDLGTVFPNGVKIGWFLTNNVFKSGVVGAGTSFYSTTALNSDNRTHTVAFKINDFVVLSFEDWNDQDYNDVQFNIWSNPIESIVTPELPDVTPEGPDDDQSVAYRMTYKGILAFEDNWPAKGDYDLNDVVVSYNSVLSFNTKNQVLSTEDVFTTLWSGALYKNGFAYQMNTDRPNVECTILEGKSAWNSQGLDQDLSQATIVLFANAVEETMGEKTSTFKVRNVLKSPVDHEVFGVAPYNPFIFPHQNTGKNRVEVHLINNKPTDKANVELFHTLQDLSNPGTGVYYVSEERYPYAINLIDAQEYSTTERVVIDQSYPRFATWAKSGGTTDKDWYLKK